MIVFGSILATVVICMATLLLIGIAIRPTEKNEENMLIAFSTACAIGLVGAGIMIGMMIG